MWKLDLSNEYDGWERLPGGEVGPGTGPSVGPYPHAYPTWWNDRDFIWIFGGASANGTSMIPSPLFYFSLYHLALHF